MSTSSYSKSTQLLLNFIKNYTEHTILLNSERANKEMQKERIVHLSPVVLT